MVTNGKRGAVSEMLAASYFLELGYEVFRSVSQDCSCDLMIYKDNQIQRVEVRTAHGPSPNRNLDPTKKGRFTMPNGTTGGRKPKGNRPRRLSTRDRILKDTYVSDDAKTDTVTLYTTKPKKMNKAAGIAAIAANIGLSPLWSALLAHGAMKDWKATGFMGARMTSRRAPRRKK